jgi:hypothetical protein
MMPWEVLLLVVRVGYDRKAQRIARYRPDFRLLAGGIRIVARVSQIGEAKVEAARRHYEMYAKAAGSAGLPGSRNRVSGTTNPSDLLIGKHI